MHNELLLGLLRLALADVVLDLLLKLRPGTLLGGRGGEGRGGEGDAWFGIRNAIDPSKLWP